MQNYTAAFREMHEAGFVPLTPRSGASSRAAQMVQRGVQAPLPSGLAIAAKRLNAQKNAPNEIGSRRASVPNPTLLDGALMEARPNGS